MNKHTIGGKTQRSKKSIRQPTSLPIVLILAMIVCLLTSMVAVIQASAGLANKLPVTLHSLLFADYSADLIGFRIAAVRFNLIEEAIRDADDSQNLDSADRFATLQAYLNTSVPTVTPEFPQTPTTPTITQQQPTTTPDQIGPSPSPSPTYLPTQTATAVPTQLQPSPTMTKRNPTATSRPDKPLTPPEDPDPTDPQPIDPPSPTDRPAPSPTKQPPPPPTKAPPPSDPYPPAYP